LLNNKNKSNFEVFNLGTGNGYTVLDIINTFESVTGTNINYKIVKRRDGDVTALYAATDLAKKELNWQAYYKLEDMISSAWNWEKKLRSNLDH
jgi:UDP-glucose 4-epimerase